MEAPSGASPKLLEVSETEVVIDFRPNAKCRRELHLRSLHPTLPVHFKVQTSSPDTFHVTPPCGSLPPLSSAPLHLTLRPIPPPSPRPRFLILSSLSPSPPCSPPRAPPRRRRLRRRRRRRRSPPPPSRRRRRRRRRGAEGAGGGRRRSGREGWGGEDGAARGGGEGHVRCARVLVGEGGAGREGRARRTPLWAAAASGKAEVVAALLEMGADPAVADARGRAPAHVARDKGHQAVVDVLECGEMVMTAARHGDVCRLRSLLNKRATIHSRDQYGTTALHSAAIKGHCEAMALLVESGADVESADVEGHTPLHLAVESGCAAAVEMLVDLGANVNAKTKRGATPLCMAAAIGHDGIARLLLSRGATAATATATVTATSLCAASSSSSSSVSCD
ncbi:Ankyrin-2 [Ananas comosus]|uniref:Ankyrin-2 n=1 Tax=Ananas comosus TaxID=4615 RepID=A0A199UW51_ANACO|nr:Ankyrin-2 [Ananas comosus]